jgi:uncharacterized protein (TIGR03118 family)
MRIRTLKLAMLLAAGLAVAPAGVRAQGNHYKQTPLVGNTTAVGAPHTDGNLVNPWGIAFGPGTLFWIADNNSGFSTLYDASGNINPLAVTIPPPSVSNAPATPTGIVYNGSSSFQITDGGVTAASQFIFSTEDGTLSAWNGTGNQNLAVRVVDNPNFGSGSDPVYKGLAMGAVGQNLFLYATNFRTGKIDVFDAQFHPAAVMGTFTDPNLPAGFAPFGIHNINGMLYVTYAMQDQPKHDPVHAPGAGVVDIFDTNGNFSSRLINNGGALNAPWGVVMAPTSFGAFGGDLLVGNFGDGLINAFDPTMGTLLGTLQDQNGQNIVNASLWDMVFGANGTGSPSTLYFSAGLNNEMGGLFATLDPAQANPAATADFALTASTMNPSEALGSSTMVTIGANAMGGFSSPIALACVNLPPGVSCSFSSSSIVPGGNPSSSTLTLSTNARTYGLVFPGGFSRLGRNGPALALLAVVAAILFFVLRRSTGSSRMFPASGLAARVALVFVLVLPLLLAACGYSSSMKGTPPPMSTVMVTGTSGQLAHTISLTLTVH